MVTMRRRDQGNGQRVASAAYYRLLITTVIAAYLVTSCNCLPTAKEKPSHYGGALLSSAVNEIEGALSRLKQYAKSLAEADKSSHQEDEDPLAESVERESRDEDYRQEPEIVPGLDRFEKNLDEAAGSSGRSAQKSGSSSSYDQSSNRDDLNDISLQDLVNFVREHKKDNKKEGESRESEIVARSTAKPTTVASSSGKSKDISLKDLLEFLKERQNQKNKDHAGIATQHPDLPVERRVTNAEVKTVAKDDSSDVSLKDALEYLASLKKKLNENERTE